MPIKLLALLSLWMSVSAPILADCQLTRLGGIEAVFEPGRLYLPAKVNGRKVLFQIDTGASTILFRDVAEKLGVKLKEDARSESYGVTGESRIDSRAVLDTFEIGHWSSQNKAMRAVGPGTAGEIDGVPVIGLLGEDFLFNFDVEINIREKLFALYQPEGCDGANLAYWTREFNIADMIRTSQQPPRIEVQAMLDGRTLAVELDTGAPYTVLSKEVAAALDVTPDSPGTQPAGVLGGIHGSYVPTWVGTFKSFELDQEKIAPARIDFLTFTHTDFHGASRTAGQVVDVDMLLGFDFLQAHHLLISHSQRKVYFSYVGGRPFQWPKPAE